MNNIEDYSLTEEQMHHLSELGVEIGKTALVFYRTCSHYKWGIRPDRGRTPFLHENKPTLILSEVLKMLPRYIEEGGRTYVLKMDHVSMWYEDLNDTSREDLSDTFFGDDLLEASYKMLCWCAEEGYLECDNE